MGIWSCGVKDDHLSYEIQIATMKLDTHIDTTSAAKWTQGILKKSSGCSWTYKNICCKQVHYGWIIRMVEDVTNHNSKQNSKEDTMPLQGNIFHICKEQRYSHSKESCLILLQRKSQYIRLHGAPKHMMFPNEVLLSPILQTTKDKSIIWHVHHDLKIKSAITSCQLPPITLNQQFHDHKDSSNNNKKSNLLPLIHAIGTFILNHQLSVYRNSTNHYVHSHTHNKLTMIHTLHYLARRSSQDLTSRLLTLPNNPLTLQEISATPSMATKLSVELDHLTLSDEVPLATTWDSIAENFRGKCRSLRSDLAFPLLLLPLCKSHLLHYLCQSVILQVMAPTTPKQNRSTSKASQKRSTGEIIWQVERQILSLSMEETDFLQRIGLERFVSRVNWTAFHKELCKEAIDHLTEEGFTTQVRGKRFPIFPNSWRIQVANGFFLSKTAVSKQKDLPQLMMENLFPSTSGKPPPKPMTSTENFRLLYCWFTPSTHASPTLTVGKNKATKSAHLSVS